MNAAAPAPPLGESSIWPLIGPALFFLLAGGALFVWPRAFLTRYSAVLGWMRRFPGRRLVEWEMGHLQSRAAVIVTRSFGAFVMLAGLSIVFVYGMAAR